MAARAEEVGRQKASADWLSTLTLAGLAGAFIAMGAMFATTVAAGVGLPYGAERLLAGLAFSLGLILVLVAGAELFTGNNLIAMAWWSGRITATSVARNWLLVYAGNFAGALAAVGLVYVSRQYTFGGGAVGAQALATAAGKVELGFGQAIALGILCNALVCVAVWLCYSARSTADRILAIILPMAAFVASGFEHSIANMYFVPIGILIKGDSVYVASIDGLPDLANLTWGSFFLDNLLPVTIGNVIGGALLVGAVYWFVYLRPGRSQTT
jgi:formate/nitrite transporter